MDVKMVPLLPDEAADVLIAGRAAPEVDAEEAGLLSLVAEGLSNAAIARELGISPRSVQRRLARLQDRLGVTSKSELAVSLARQGFGRRRGGMEAGRGTSDETPGGVAGMRVSPGKHLRGGRSRRFVDI